LGLQVASIEFARNVLGYTDANSTEINPNTEHPVIDLMTTQSGLENLGGTQRLGLYPCALKEGSKARELYNDEALVEERHRHRWEFNNAYREEFEAAGMVFSGTSPDGNLVEIVEIPEHPFFVASQFHPEFISRPDRPQAIFNGFIGAALEA
ncbi:glutamine amidotransferase-related protein, partial [Aerococcus sp. L_4]